MSKVIRIDDEVMRALQDKARELGLEFSNPNNVIRIIVGLAPLPGSTHTPRS